MMSVVNTETISPTSEYFTAVDYEKMRIGL